jgi:hypothetical protein
MIRRKPIVSRPDLTSDGKADPLDCAFGAAAPAETTTPPDRTADPEPCGAADVPDGLDPFDPAALRLSQDFAANLGVKKALLTVPVRKPDKSWFVRTHPDETCRLQTAVIELKEDRETYLVAQPLWPVLAAESTFSPRALFTAINRQGVLFLWPIRLPGTDGKVDVWSRTALDATEMATKRWVRVTANLSLGAYEVFEATGQLGEPSWPSTPFVELLRIAFRDRLISSLDHPVLRRLRGEA